MFAGARGKHRKSVSWVLGDQRAMDLIVKFVDSYDDTHDGDVLTVRRLQTYINEELLQQQTDAPRDDDASGGPRQRLGAVSWSTARRVLGQLNYGVDDEGKVHACTITPEVVAVRTEYCECVIGDLHRTYHPRLFDFATELRARHAEQAAVEAAARAKVEAAAEDPMGTGVAAADQNDDDATGSCRRGTRT